MDYIQVQNKLNNLCAFSVKSGLERFYKLMELVLNPHEKLKVIHVAGTNGKGSVCSFVSSMLIESGYKTGLFLSPFVFEFGERISINRKMIEAEEFIDILQGIEKPIEALSKQYGKFTQFEVNAAVAFIYFAKQNCDFVVLETGIGGRLDVTNIFESPLVTAITSISLDHVNMLGSTVKDIACEKAGIIKNNVDLVVYPNVSQQILDIFKEKCKTNKSKCIVADYVDIKHVYSTAFYTRLKLYNREFNIKLPGKHQINNLKTALAMIDVLKNKGVNFKENDILLALEKTFLPGRIEVLLKEPTIIVDGAHNEESSLALCEYISENFDGKKLIAIIASMKDKNYCDLFKNTSKYFDEVITVSMDDKRAMDADELKNVARNYFKKVNSMKLLEALSYAKNKLHRDDAVFIFGSFYIIKQARDVVEKVFN